MLGYKLGIDFGSANLTIVAEDKGILLSQPSVVVTDAYTGRIIAMGKEAKRMEEKLPGSMKTVYPIKDGIVNDIKIAVEMLKGYLDRICSGKLFRPNVLISVPSTVSELEKKTIFDVVIMAGAGTACFAEHSLAAAIGAGIGLSEMRGSFVCDIGGGTCNCAVVAGGNIVCSASVKVGGNDITEQIRNYILHEHGIEIGRLMAERVKKTVGTAVYRSEEVAFIATGKNCDTGLPVLFEITSTEVYWVLKSSVEKIFSCIRQVLEPAPPEVVSDLFDSGIILTGGTSNLYGIDRYIEWNSGLRTRRAKHPEQCAALGLMYLLENMKFLQNNGYVFARREKDDDED